MTRRPPATTAGDPVTSLERYCHDCVPPLHVQGGDWGWRAHRYALHGDGTDPGLHPPPARPPLRQWTPWTAGQHAEFHRRRQAARRKARHVPPARGPRPPMSTG